MGSSAFFRDDTCLSFTVALWNTALKAGDLQAMNLITG